MQQAERLDLRQVVDKKAERRWLTSRQVLEQHTRNVFVCVCTSLNQARLLTDHLSPGKQQWLIHRDTHTHTHNHSHSGVITDAHYRNQFN